MAGTASTNYADTAINVLGKVATMAGVNEGLVNILTTLAEAFVPTPQQPNPFQTLYTNLIQAIQNMIQANYNEGLISAAEDSLSSLNTAIQAYCTTAPPQYSTMTTAAVNAGTEVSIPVASSANFTANARVSIDTGANQEIFLVTSVPDGTHITADSLANNHASGVPLATPKFSTTTTAAVNAGTIVSIAVASSADFTPNAQVSIDTGANQETFLVMSDPPPDPTHITADSLAHNHPSGVLLVTPTPAQWSAQNNLAGQNGLLNMDVLSTQTGSPYDVANEMPVNWSGQSSRTF